jgi:hypothetical protein
MKGYFLSIGGLRYKLQMNHHYIIDFGPSKVRAQLQTVCVANIVASIVLTLLLVRVKCVR